MVEITTTSSNASSSYQDASRSQPPDDRSLEGATIELFLRVSSPTLSLSKSDDTEPFYLIATARIKSNAHPSLPITLCSGRGGLSVTALAVPPACEKSNIASPALRGHAIRDVVEKDDPKKKIAWPHYRSWAIPPFNLRDDKYMTFITVPATGSIEVKHYLPRSEFEKCGARAGETYITSLDTVRSSAGCRWWTWGDLETDLQGKKFGRAGGKDGKGGIVEEGPEWAVTKAIWKVRQLDFEHSEECIEIKIVD